MTFEILYIILVIRSNYEIATENFNFGGIWMDYTNGKTEGTQKRTSKPTVFGKEVRKVRLDRDMTLGSMASDLDYSPAYLSAIEIGKREIPDDLVQKLAERYGLSDAEEDALYRAQMDVRGNVSVQLGSTEDSPERRELAVEFARDFAKLNTLNTEQLKNLLEAFRSATQGGVNGN